MSLLCACTLLGCSSSDASKMSLAKVGSYPAAPSLMNRPRLGVTSFAMDLDSAANALGDYAADQMAQMLGKSNRFAIVDRQSFSRMVDHQNLTGAFKPGQVVQAASIDGVDYVLVGTISNLSIVKKAEEPGMVDKMKELVTRAGARKDVVVSATCGVGFSIIDPTTSDIVIANNSEFARTSAAPDLGIDVMEDTSNVAAGAELPVNHADCEKVIQLALDDAIRKSLPKIDRFLASRRSGALASTPTAPPSHTVNLNDAAAPAAAKSTTTQPSSDSPVAPAATVGHKSCPVCGAENESKAKFCKKCGSKI
jgi:curli biogenesis system outer membrane secretion channel CsgG/ribosomal protein L40E